MTLKEGSEKQPLLAHPLLWRIAALCTFLVAVRRSESICHSAMNSTLDYPIQILSTYRILHGELPYRNFETLYGPLGYYISAFFLWPFRFLSPVAAFNCYLFGCLTFFYAIICIDFSRLRLQRPLFLLGAAVLIARSAKSLISFAYYSLPMLVPVIIAIGTVQLSIDSPSRTPKRTLFWQCVTGAMIAAEIFIRINFGGYLAMAVLLTGIVAFCVGNKPVAVAALRCLIAATGFTVLLLAIFAITGIAAPFVADMRLYLPRAVLGRNVPWKYVQARQLAMATGISLIATLLRCGARLLRREVGFYLVPYILLCGFFSYTFMRFDVVHILPFIVLSFMLLTSDANNRFDTPSRNPSSFSTWVRRCFGLPELQLAALFLLFVTISPTRPTTWILHRLSLAPQARQIPGVVMPMVAQDQPTTVLRNVSLATQEANMLHRLDALRKPGDEVYWMSAPGSCQSTFDMCANISLYLAEGILPQQYIWYFDTANTPYEDIQQRIITGLETKKTPWIGMQDVYLQNTVGVSRSESTLLRDYVLTHYNVVFTTEIPGENRRYSIYTRRLQD